MVALTGIEPDSSRPNQSEPVRTYPSLVAFGMPVAINTMGTRKRMSMALSCGDFEEHAERLADLIKLPADPPKSFAQALKMAPNRLNTQSLVREFEQDWRQVIR